MVKVAITSPSLKVEDNVSGIANHTRLLISVNKTIDFCHVVVGKKDAQPRNIYWFFNQFLVTTRFFIKCRNVDIIHLNVPLANFSLIMNLGLAFLSRVLRKPLVIHFRGGELSLSSKHSFFQKHIINYLLSRSNIIIVLGERERQLLL